MSRRTVVWTILAAVVLVALIPVGRWEKGRHARTENDGIRRVLAAIGPIDQGSLDGYRQNVAWGTQPGFDCLLYKRGANPFALEFCFTPSGRVIEAYDRRGSSPRIWSLREDRSAAAVQLDAKKLLALIDRLRRPVG